MEKEAVITGNNLKLPFSKSSSVSIPIVNNFMCYSVFLQNEEFYFGIFK